MLNQSSKSSRSPRESSKALRSSSTVAEPAPLSAGYSKIDAHLGDLLDEPTLLPFHLVVPLLVFFDTRGIRRLPLALGSNWDLAG